MTNPGTAFPWEAVAVKKYRSPHKEDLSFSKGERIRVIGLAPKDEDDDEDEDDEDEDDQGDQWLIGESLDGSKQGTFPAANVKPTPSADEAAVQEQNAAPSASPVTPSETQAIAPSSAAATAAAATPANTETELAQTKQVTGFGAPLPHRAPESDQEQEQEQEAAQVSQPVDKAEPSLPTESVPAPPAATTPAAPISTPKSPEPHPAPPSAAAAPATSNPTPSSAKAPPPPAPKPSGLAARIAAFNKPAEASAPVPLPRPAGAGGGWKRPPPAPGAPKPVVPGFPTSRPQPSSQSTTSSTDSAPATAVDVASPASASASASAEGAVTSERTNSGFSAADAQTSIKMSLKERMAALQRGGASGEKSDDAEPRSPPALAPKPGRLGADKKNVALAGMGLAAVPPSATPTSPAKEDGPVSPAVEPATTDAVTPAVTTQDDAVASTDGNATTSTTTAAAADADAEPIETSAEGGGDVEVEKTEEELEAERRAAIAKRMAALGGRRMGGPLFGGPPAPVAPSPAPARQASNISEAGSVRVDAADVTSPISPVKAEEREASNTDAPSSETKPATLAVPRRAAPPRKKRSGGAAAAAATSPGEAPKEDPITAPTPAAEGEAVGLAAPASAESKESGDATAADEEEATVPAAAAAVETPTDQTEATTEEPVVEDKTVPDDEGTSPSAIPAVPAAASLLAVERATADRRGSADTTTTSELELRHHAAELDEFVRSQQGNELGDAGLDDDQDAALQDILRQHETSSARASSTAGDESASAAAAEVRSTLARSPAPRPPSTSTTSRPPSTRPPIPKSSLPHLAPATAASDAPISPSSPPPPIPVSRCGSILVDRNVTASPVPAPPKRDLPTPSPAGTDGGDSRRMSLPPPLPRSPPPRVPTAEPEALSRQTEEEEEDDEQSNVISPVQSFGGAAVALGAAGAGAGAAAAGAAAPTLLAAPKPRHALPAEESDDEDGQEIHEPQVAPTASARSEHVAVAAQEEQEQETEAETETEAEQEQEHEQTEEEAEAERRAAIARRMAALGGQRMGGMPPIMGAPMPPRKKASVSAPSQEEGEAGERAEAEVTDAGAPVASIPRRGPPRGGMAIPGLVAVPTTAAELEAARSEEPEEPSRLASPPPVPNAVGPPPLPEAVSPAPRITSPPPRPLSAAPPVPRPGSTGPNAPRREGSTSSEAAPPASVTLGRRTSMRPAVPLGIHSRETSEVVGEAEEQMDEQRFEDGEAEEEEEEEREVAQPPALPSAPPPRAPPSAPVPAPPSHEAPLPSTPIGGTSALSTSPSLSHLQPSKPSPRDLDLMLSSRWWRQGINPLRLPPSLTARPDVRITTHVLPSSIDASNRPRHSADIKVLFEDCSTTRISIGWSEGDEQESTTSVEQEHAFPPVRPGAEVLQRWSREIGSQIAANALHALKVGMSVPRGSPGNASSIFINMVLSQVPSALPSVGSTWGTPLLSIAGGTVLDNGGDEVRPGDIMGLYGAELKGKKGLGSYTQSFGSAEAPVYVVVTEVESGKKNKVRGVLCPSAQTTTTGGGKGNRTSMLGGVGSGGAGGSNFGAGSSTTTTPISPEEVSIRMEDLRSGLCRVFRVPPRNGWVDV